MKKILLILLFSIFNSAFADYNSVSIAWDYNCPWMCNTPSKPGFLFELVTEIYRLSNIKIQFQKNSWPLAKLEVKEGRALGLLSPSKEEAVGFYFPKKHLAKRHMCFFASKNLNWIYTDERSLTNIKLGISFRNTYNELNKYIDLNRENIKKLKFLNVENIYETGFEYLKSKQFDVLLVDHSAADYYLKKTNQEQEFKKVGCLELEKIYLAFTPKFQNKSNYLASILDKNIEILKNNNFFEVLKKKYEIDEFNFEE
ncbi:hypothetical protein QEJ31_04990 [Pigmentibacter sp. JX0631]|uniref:transporter substrate-binding domain-containing protein n=1 Tax=Pigmentibacter sp. JX0631 TaxID=2976982 RepID=UPI002468B911|nr:transporter substrate-binding domain-containing protein [Pigmentibacter sp. JX0631]WGL60952.1 hypothetical protein QEJ31_04990 [Pigmentibacter sp. JX0631]